MDGILLYDNAQCRFVVRELVEGVVTDDAAIIELHYGDRLAIRVKRGEWIDTHIEKGPDDSADSWYFTGIGRVLSFVGHRVRVK